MCKSMHSLPCIMCVTYDFVTVYTYYVHNFSTSEVSSPKAEGSTSEVSSPKAGGSTLEVPSSKAGAKRKDVPVSSSDGMLEQGN